MHYKINLSIPSLGLQLIFLNYQIKFHETFKKIPNKVYNESKHHNQMIKSCKSNKFINSVNQVLLNIKHCSQTCYIFRILITSLRYQIL